MKQNYLERIPAGREGWVYLIHAEGTNRYKIGRSVNPITRCADIQKQSPYPLKIIRSFWTLDAVADESYLHDIFANYRVYGEWFDLEGFVTSEYTKLWHVETAFEQSHVICEIASDAIDCFCQQLNIQEAYCLTTISIYKLYSTLSDRAALLLAEKFVRETLPQLVLNTGYRIAGEHSSVIDWLAITSTRCFLRGVHSRFCIRGIKSESLTMPIIRTKRKRHNFSIIDNSGLMDGSLSWKATGMLAFLMTKPDDWQISVENLTGAKRDGRDSTISALEELKKAGYVYFRRFRVNGRFESEYLVFETQEDLQEWLEEQGLYHNGKSGVADHSGKTIAEKPSRKNHRGKTATENPTQVINKELITEELITEELITEHSPPTPSQEEQESEREKKGNTEQPETGSKPEPPPSSPEQTQPLVQQTDPVKDKSSEPPRKFPWETNQKRQFDPGFEHHLLEAFKDYPAYKDKPYDKQLTKIRKHVALASFDTKREEEIWIEWEAFNAVSPNGVKNTGTSSSLVSWKEWADEAIKRRVMNYSQSHGSDILVHLTNGQAKLWSELRSLSWDEIAACVVESA